MRVRDKATQEADELIALWKEQARLTATGSQLVKGTLIDYKGHKHVRYVEIVRIWPILKATKEGGYWVVLWAFEGFLTSKEGKRVGHRQRMVNRLLDGFDVEVIG